VCVEGGGALSTHPFVSPDLGVAHAAEDDIVNLVGELVFDSVVLSAPEEVLVNKCRQLALPPPPLATNGKGNESGSVLPRLISCAKTTISRSALRSAVVLNPKP
jgi:hypothetical protein